MEKKQTAVEWLIEQLANRQNGEGSETSLDELFEQAKERGKQGRKPITDCSKRVPLRVMVEQCTINEWGGMKRAQMYVQDFLERGPDELPVKK